MQHITVKILITALGLAIYSHGYSMPGEGAPAPLHRPAATHLVPLQTERSNLFKLIEAKMELARRLHREYSLKYAEMKKELSGVVDQTNRLRDETLHANFEFIKIEGKYGKGSTEYNSAAAKFHQLDTSYRASKHRLAEEKIRIEKEKSVSEAEYTELKTRRQLQEEVYTHLKSIYDQYDNAVKDIDTIRKNLEAENTQIKPLEEQLHDLEQGKAQVVVIGDKKYTIDAIFAHPELLGKSDNALQKKIMGYNSYENSKTIALTKITDITDKMNELQQQLNALDVNVDLNPNTKQAQRKELSTAYNDQVIELKNTQDEYNHILATGSDKDNILHDIQINYSSETKRYLESEIWHRQEAIFKNEAWLSVSTTDMTKAKESVEFFDKLSEKFDKLRAYSLESLHEALGGATLDPEQEAVAKATYALTQEAREVITDFILNGNLLADRDGENVVEQYVDNLTKSIDTLKESLTLKDEMTLYAKISKETNMFLFQTKDNVTEVESGIEAQAESVIKDSGDLSSLLSEYPKNRKLQIAMLNAEATAITLSNESHREIFFADKVTDEKWFEALVHDSIQKGNITKEAGVTTDDSLNQFEKLLKYQLTKKIISKDEYDIRLGGLDTIRKESYYEARLKFTDKVIADLNAKKPITIPKDDSSFVHLFGNVAEYNHALGEHHDVEPGTHGRTIHERREHQGREHQEGHQETRHEHRDVRPTIHDHVPPFEPPHDPDEE